MIEMSKIIKKISAQSSSYSRREFLKISGNMAVLIGTGGALKEFIWLKNGIAAVPASEGYLLVDTKKCQGCLTCMLSCSLCHEGKESLSLSRIQILQNPFEGYPNDLNISQCRQCVDPECVAACPAEALFVDEEHGNIRRIDESKCIGCESCIEACPFTPSRSSWDGDEEHALKCDLCLDTPYWNQEGGPGGKQACVELCPLGALMFTNEIPDQQGNKGYDINLRGKGWKRLGFSVDD
jgi:protein NrfC